MTPQSETQSEGITPRVLLRIELEETYNRDPTTRYDAQTVNQSIRGGNNYTKEIVGYAEFPVNTKVSTREEFEDFRKLVEVKAEYIHWKPNAGGE